ncbi:MAG: prevent-host-death protein [Candidatus Magnetoglobus multicellularis str. Araruama]|uniref:Antitoxin n=1 Tax=Candidatus Magnetoglobus multicellularis str. Araruama TaxID=890399 RepID=A0A1V1P7Z1_9BACT|nr:MAG: prevent-host-death protein [Candidatus Magnetoglobus multicellularis str. Araruama]
MLPNLKYELNSVKKFDIIPILEKIRTTQRTMTLTNMGQPEAVLMDIKEYEKIIKAFGLLKLLAPAEEDVANSQYTEARSFFQEFKSENQIHC